MTGFGFPGEDLFNWVYHTLKGYKCNQCGRKMPKEQLSPYGVCSFECKDKHTCGVLSRRCDYCKHYVDSVKFGNACVATGKEEPTYQMWGETEPCGWKRKLFEKKIV